jgi:hypothetical protein
MQRYGRMRSLGIMRRQSVGREFRAVMLRLMVCGSVPLAAMPQAMGMGDTPLHMALTSRQLVAPRWATERVDRRTQLLLGPAARRWLSAALPTGQAMVERHTPRPLVQASRTLQAMCLRGEAKHLAPEVAALPRRGAMQQGLEYGLLH